jgi:hypothetical protein
MSRGRHKRHFEIFLHQQEKMRFHIGAPTTYCYFCSLCRSLQFCFVSSFSPEYSMSKNHDWILQIRNKLEGGNGNHQLIKNSSSNNNNNSLLTQKLDLSTLQVRSLRDHYDPLLLQNFYNNLLVPNFPLEEERDDLP